jgi:hypothetical protein
MCVAMFNIITVIKMLPVKHIEKLKTFLGKAYRFRGCMSVCHHNTNRAHVMFVME